MTALKLISSDNEFDFRCSFRDVIIFINRKNVHVEKIVKNAFGIMKYLLCELTFAH